MKKRVLIPNGSIPDCSLVKAAHRLDMHVIVSGLNANAPANKLADEYVPADYSDKEAMLELAKEKKIDYMVSNAHDFGMLSTAYVCEKLGLPGHDSYETTLTIHNKDRFKPLAKKLGIHSPISEIFTDRSKAIEYIKNADRPMIIKPADNVASHGVSLPKTVSEIVTSVDYALQNSKIKSIIVEPFIEGFYGMVSCMLINQKVVAFFADSSNFYPQGEVVGDTFPSYSRINGGMQPCMHIRTFAPTITEDFNKIAEALHLVDGKFHCELMVENDGTAHIIDVHRRFSGYPDLLPVWQRSSIIQWEDWVVRAECGMDLSQFPAHIKQDRHVHWRRIYAPRNGKLKRVILDNYLTSHLFPPVWDQRNYVVENIGDITDHYHQHVAILSFAFATYDEAEYVGDFVNDHFYEHITFEYED